MPVTWSDVPATTIIRERVVQPLPAPARRAEGGIPSDTLSLEGGTVGGLAGIIAGSSVAAVTRVNPVVGILGGLVLGAVAGSMGLSAARDTVVVRHHLAATVGTMAGGGALAIGALTLGVTSGAIVAGAAVVGAALGAYGLARAASLFE